MKTTAPALLLATALLLAPSTSADARQEGRGVSVR